MDKCKSGTQIPFQENRRSHRFTNRKLQTFFKPDGKTYVTETYLEPIHFKEKGQWTEIDNTIQNKFMDAKHIYTNGSNRYKVGFAKSTSKRDSTMKFQVGTSSMEFLPVDAEETNAVVKGDTITYPNAYVGVDLVYTVTGTGIKEEWYIKKKPSRSTFSTELRLLHLQPKKNKDGSISLFDDNGKSSFDYSKTNRYRCQGGDFSFHPV